jgi:hypothetical protein
MTRAIEMQRSEGEPQPSLELPVQCRFRRRWSCQRSVWNDLPEIGRVDVEYWRRWFRVFIE